MRTRLVLVTLVVTLLTGMVLAQGQRRQRLNPMIELLEQKKPVFGMYMPTNPRQGGGRGGRGSETPAAPQAAAVPALTPSELGKVAVEKRNLDFLFNGSMPADFPEFQKGMLAAGALVKTESMRLTHPVMFKIHKISDDPAAALKEMHAQLDLGASGQMFVEVESAKEVEQGLAGMRFKVKGGTRPESVGAAPPFWGMTEQQYRQKADLWPLNPDGELLNWTIIESLEGLEKTREIAATKGIGVLWPGAGTLRGVTSKTNAAGQREPDPVAWEAAIQKVLAACKEFNVPCGYPANENDIEMRMKQGFSVFVISWGPDYTSQAGLRAVEKGRAASGRTTLLQQ